MRRALVLSILVFAVLSSPLRAYTPESPEVQQLVRRGIQFIERNAASSHGRYDGELGASCIAALAHLQATGVDNHDLVARAVAQIEREITVGLPHRGHGNYSLALATILLCELNSEKYRTLIESLVAEIYARQTSGGAWTYPNDPLGDTSQTQFAVLAMWLADQRGFVVRRPAVERVCNWLLRVQAPDGVYPYKGADPGGFERTSQSRTSMSMCAAGVGSLYACGELLGLTDDPLRRSEQHRLPAALRLVSDEAAATEAVERPRWGRAIADANRWLAEQGDVENRDQGQRYQQYYYLYAMERYRAFRELAEGELAEGELAEGELAEGELTEGELAERSMPAEPAWYNEGVDYLREHQADDGSWESTQNGPVIDTAFAVLFLLRSARRAVARGRTGILGRPELPLDEMPLSEILKRWEDLDEPAGGVARFAEQLELSRDRSERASQLARLRRLLVNGPFHARYAAAKLLGTVRDLENCPHLIFALSDPDARVVRAARDALRFISRKPEGFGFQVFDGQRPDEPAWRAAQRNWSLWLLSVKPDAGLVE